MAIPDVKSQPDRFEITMELVKKTIEMIEKPQNTHLHCEVFAHALIAVSEGTPIDRALADAVYSWDL